MTDNSECNEDCGFESEWCEHCGGSGQTYHLDDIPIECPYCGGNGVND